MIEFLQCGPEGVKRLEQPVDKCWINVTAPNEQEIDRLNKIFNVPSEILDTLRDYDEIPTIEQYQDFFFMLIRTPQKNAPHTDLQYSTIPLGIIISRQHVITICFSPNDVVDKLEHSRCEDPVLYLLLISARMYLNYLKEINRKIGEIQKDLERSTRNQKLIQLLSIAKSLEYFSTSLKANEYLIERLSRSKELIKSLAGKKIIADVIDENKQAIEMTTIYLKILRNTMDAFTSIISNNLNTVIKTLTSVTIILMIPTLVASIYGMNVSLPFQGSPHAFLIIMLMSVLVSMGGIIYFWRNDIF